MRVLSLCDRTGVMVQPWLKAGHYATTVDLGGFDGYSPSHPGWLRVAADVRTWTPTGHYDIVFAFPPCTNLAVSGARWFQDKGLQGLIDGLGVVEACRRICVDNGAPWMLENPVSTLSTYWRPPDHMFDPCDFAGYADDPDTEAYTKRTCLWVGGGFVFPHKRWVEPTLGSLFHRTPPGPDRGDIRSVTPKGFARAVFDANHAHIQAAA